MPSGARATPLAMPRPRTHGSASPPAGSTSNRPARGETLPPARCRGCRRTRRSAAHHRPRPIRRDSDADRDRHRRGVRRVQAQQRAARAPVPRLTGEEQAPLAVDDHRLRRPQPERRTRARGRRCHGCTARDAARPSTARSSGLPLWETRLSLVGLTPAPPPPARGPGKPLLAGALPWRGQTARATRGRDLQLNVPFPRKPPDLLMAESPPAGGLSALRARSRPVGGKAPDQGRMSFSVAVKRSPDSSSSPSMCRRAGPVSVHRSRK